MKIFDCSLYYDEDLILELRLNMLSRYVDKFVISESKYTHSGQKKKLNFNINNFPEFKNKIIYLVDDNEPSDLLYENKNGNKIEKAEHRRINSVKRIAHQRNKLIEGLTEANDEDFIFFIYVFTWNMKATMSDDIGSLPYYRIIIKFVKYLFALT